MAKAIKEIQSKLNQIDLIIETRDARLPLSSINPKFEKLIQTHSNNRDQEREQEYDQGNDQRRTINLNGFWGESSSLLEIRKRTILLTLCEATLEGFTVIVITITRKSCARFS